MTASRKNSSVNTPTIAGSEIYQQVLNLSTQSLDKLLKSMFVIASQQKVLKFSSEEYKRLASQFESKKRIIKSAFTFQLKKNFNDFKTIREIRVQKSKSIDWLEMGLVDGGESAETDALESMVSSYESCFNQYQQPILNGLAKCIKRSRFEELDNPIHVKRLYQSFQFAIDSLGFDAQNRIALYQLFSDTVVDNIEPLYKSIEQCFIEHKLLPQQKLMSDKTSAQETSIASKPNGSVAMSQIPVLMGVFQNFKEKSSFSNGKYSNLFPELKKELEQRKIMDFGRLIDQLSVLFDIMLSDQDLPNQIKEQIARLQIVIFMSEIQESGFATRSNHPARRLLDTVIRTEIDLANSGQAKSTGYDFLKSSIDELSNTPFIEANTYARLLKDYLECTTVNSGTKAQPKAEIKVIPTTKPAEAVKPKIKVAEKIAPTPAPKPAAEASKAPIDRSELTSELRAINNTVENIYPVIQSIINDMTLPLRVQGRSLILFDEVWSPLLLEIALSSGFKSHAWQKIMTIAKAQVWILTPKSSEQELKKLVASLSLVEKSVSQSMQSLKLPIDQQASLLEFLEHEQADVIAKSKANIEKLKKSNATAAEKEKPVETKPVASSEPKPKPEKINFANTLDEFSDLMETGRFKKSADMLEALDSDKSKPEKVETIITSAENIHKSDWVEIKRKGSLVLAKLTWKAEDGSKYIFVDREGNRVCDISKDDLNNELKAGTISIISSASGVSRQTSSGVTQTFK